MDGGILIMRIRYTIYEDNLHACGRTVDFSGHDARVIITAIDNLLERKAQSGDEIVLCRIHDLERNQ